MSDESAHLKDLAEFDKDKLKKVIMVLKQN